MNHIFETIKKLRLICSLAPSKIFYFIIRGLKARANWHLAHIHNERTPFAPLAVSIMPTQRCNLSCEFCYIWGQRADKASDFLQMKNAELSLESWEKIVIQIKDWRPKPQIQVIGGEPFVYDRIGELLKMLKKYGLFVDLVTNGVLAEKYCEHLANIGIDRVRFSLDGIGDVHDGIRGKGIFEKAHSALSALISHKERIGAKTSVEIIFTICKHNQRLIYETVKQFWSWGIDGVQINHLFFTLQENLSQHRKFLSDNFGLSAIYWNFPSDIGSLPDAEIIIPQIEKIRREFSKTVFVPSFQKQLLEIYYKDPALFSKQFKSFCGVLWNGLTIRSDGTIEVCPDIPIGNGTREEIMNIFNNETQCRVRKSFRKLKKFPICNSCCNFYTSLE